MDYCCLPKAYVSLVNNKIKLFGRPLDHFKSQQIDKNPGPSGFLDAFCRRQGKSRIGNINRKVAENLVTEHLPNDARPARNQVNAGSFGDNRYPLLKGRRLQNGDLRFSRSNQVNLIDPSRPMIFAAWKEIFKAYLAGWFVDTHPRGSRQTVFTQNWGQLRFERIQIVW